MHIVIHEAGVEVEAVGNTLHILDRKERKPDCEQLTAMQALIIQKMSLSATSPQEMAWFVYQADGSVNRYIKRGTVKRTEPIANNDPRLHPRFLRNQLQ
jgi:hypothetical protein